MKKQTLCALLVAGGLLSAYSATAAELKIGYIDVKSGVESTRIYQDGSKRLEALANQKQKELDSLRSKIAQSEKDLMGQSMAMAPERLAEKQQELKDLRKMFTRKQQDAQEELVAEQRRLQQAVFEKFFDEVRAYGKENKFDFILTKQQLLYGSAAYDLTGEIAKRLDKKK